MSFVLTNGLYQKAPNLFEPRPAREWLILFIVIAVMTCISWALSKAFSKQTP